MKLEDYSKYYIQGSDHYLIPKYEFVELFNEMINWKQENEELKKQLEDKILLEMKLENELFNKRKEYQETYKDVRIEIKEYKNQQKEFIKYLEDEIQNKREKSTTLTAFIRNVVPLQQCLQKYKEIIGDINDKK